MKLLVFFLFALAINTIPKMIPVEISKEMLESATRDARAMGRLKNSIEGIDSNIIGFLGEECFVKHYINKEKCCVSRVNNFDYDFLFNGVRVEVKSKETSSIPHENYTVNINSFNPHQEKQEVDYYFFVYILKQNGIFLRGYLAGYLSKKEFFERAIYYRKGDKDGDRDFYFKFDCYSLRMHQLNPPS